jgi:hypothetical protein
MMYSKFFILVCAFSSRDVLRWKSLRRPLSHNSIDMVVIGSDYLHAI